MDRRVGLLLTLVLAAASACSSAPRADSPQAPAPTSASGLVVGPLVASLQNGRSIFETGRDSNGARIVAQSRPLYPTCAACHHIGGAGGVHLPGGALSADLRYKALVTNQKQPYTLALTERAIATGIDNNGQPLNRVMPRWKLSKRDLHDVAFYVLTKLK